MIDASIDVAVILAAGRGNRISSVSSTPKPLLPIEGPNDGAAGGDTFLDFHLRALHAAGVKRVVLVGNRQTCGTRLRAIDDVAGAAAGSAGMAVEWVLNPTEDLSTSGSAHSASFAFATGLLDGRSRVLLMDADIVYEPRLLQRFNSKDARSIELVARSHEDTAEEVVVFAGADDVDTAVRHGKGLIGTPLVEGLLQIGEATGMVLLAPADHALALASTSWALSYSTAKTRSEHEDVTQLMMARRRVRIEAFDDALFMEVDTPAEYATLIGEMAPRLRALGVLR